MLYVATIVSKVGDNSWLINGSAIKYMAFDSKYFVTYTKCLEKQFVYLGDNYAHEIVGKVSQPHFEGSVRSPLTLPKMGFGSPLGLPKTQSTIVGVKTPGIEAFFIMLERSRSVDVQNDLA